MCRHTFATSQDSPKIGLEVGRSQHLEQALSKTMTESGCHMEASKRAGTAYLNLHKSQNFDLTHKTGSYMYMAPEVFTERKYNEKVSFANQEVYYLQSWILLGLRSTVMTMYIVMQIAYLGKHQSTVCAPACILVSWQMCLCLPIHLQT